MLKPLPGRVTVEVSDQYKYASTPDKQYQMKNSGVVIAVADPKAEYLNGKKIYFDGVWKDNIIDEKYAFVKVKDIDGYEDQ